MAARRRFWVEVTPRFAAPAHPTPSSTSDSSSGSVPRLTELAVAVGLEGAELDAELASVREQRSTLAAYEAGLIERKATLGAAHRLPLLPGARTEVRTDRGTTDGLEPDPALQAADDFLPDEVAVLLNMSVPSTRYLIEHALVLVRQLPQVWWALADGRIDETRARVIVAALRWQATSAGGPVPDATVADLAARAVGWAVAGCPPSTLKERVDTALVAADPAAAHRRAHLRRRAADVTVTGTGDGLAELRATQMDAADARLVRGQVDAYARVLKAEGDPRPIGAIRLAVLTSLVMRPWEHRDPATAHVTITADLADLDHLPDLMHLPDPANTARGDARGPATADRARSSDSPGGGPASQRRAPGPDRPDNPVPTELTAREPIPDGAVLVGPTAAQADADAWAEAGTGAGHVDGLPVTPAAVRALLQRIDALGLTDPTRGDLTYTLTGQAGRLLAVATPDELVAAAKAGAGLGPPPPSAGYTPTAAQYRYLRARDRHCRFPGCRQVALTCDADHVRPYNHRRPADGGPTCVTNLVMFCRHHHRLKTHATGWAFRLDPDGPLHVTTPGGTTRTTRPPAMDQILDLTTDPPPPYDPDDDPPPF